MSRYFCCSCEAVTVHEDVKDHGVWLAICQECGACTDEDWDQQYDDYVEREMNEAERMLAEEAEYDEYRYPW